MNRETRQSIEAEMITAMLGRSRPSTLMTDAYKFSMAQAGFPRREETFYLSFRKPGWYYIPFDLEALVLGLCPSAPSPEERAFLKRYDYALSADMESAIEAKPIVWAAPKGSWVREREPILSVTAPSFLASWLEPLLVWLQFPIQVATATREHCLDELPCSCESEARIARLAVAATNAAAANAATANARNRAGASGNANEDGSKHRREAPHIFVRNARYRENVRISARALIHSMKGDCGRLFEVGMRSATSMQMHRDALTTLAKEGVQKTSNLFLASELGLTPVGTTGHEHQQRWGRDLDGFRAIRDRRSGMPSYLFDTYDSISLGIPAAITAIAERPEISASVRFDSGDHAAQLKHLVASGVRPTFIFMDSMDPERIAHLEGIASTLEIPREKRLYGVGGYWIGKPSPGTLIRDRVAAVYKLSESGGKPVMKFSVPTKISAPGRPVVFRRIAGDGPVGLIGQAGETPPPSYAL